MLPFKKILFPVDFSPPCDAIVPYVKDVVHHYNAELTLVHALLPNTAFFAEGMAMDTSWIGELRETETKRLHQFAAEAFPGIHVETILREGEPGSVIEHTVQHQGADLVMLPTHGHGPIRRLLLGSVTTKVLHGVSAAVWTGVGSMLEGHKPGIPYKSILCALDESKEAEAVLRAAASLAKMYGAHLTLLHAVATPPMALEVDYRDFRKALMDAADVRLRDLKESVGIDAPHVVTDTMLTESIQQEALKRKTDLIVAGRGEAQEGLSRIWSMLYPMIREAPCPVLSI